MYSGAEEQNLSPGLYLQTSTPNSSPRTNNWSLNSSSSQFMFDHRSLATTTEARPQIGSQRNGEQDDEISKSLQMFAMLTAHNEKNETSDPHSVETAMQEFACNGYNCDDIQSIQQYKSALNLPPKVNTLAIQNNNSFQNFYQAQMNLNLNNMWTHAGSYRAVFGVSSRNIDYSGKPQKRCNSVKTEKYSTGRQQHCVFCENNNEPEPVVKSHAVRDSLGRVLCPKLRTYICPICNASGDDAHTIKYCPQKPIITMEDAIKAESFRLAKGTFHNQQMRV